MGGVTITHLRLECTPRHRLRLLLPLLCEQHANTLVTMRPAGDKHVAIQLDVEVKHHIGSLAVAKRAEMGRSEMRSEMDMARLTLPQVHTIIKRAYNLMPAISVSFSTR